MAAVIIFLLIICSILLIPYIDASPLSRIINGTAAIASNTQHQVSIRSKDEEIIFGWGHLCGGSLITPNIVLTAAHCFYDDENETFSSHENYFIVMGTMERLKKTENTVSSDLAEIVYHDFDRLTFENDLAVVKLKENMPISSNPAINVIPLNREVIPAGTVCQVTGWGVTREDGTLSKILMTVDLPIIDLETCSTNYEEGYIMDGMICAGFMEGGKDACQGDSGGPIVSNGKLVGITSYGDGCAQPGFPGVYTNVSYYADWIDDKIANLTSIVKPEDNNKPSQNTTLSPGNNNNKPVIKVNVISLSFNFLINVNSKQKQN